MTRGLRGGPVVSVLDRQQWDSGFKSRPGQKFGSRFLLHLHPLANSAMTSTLTACSQWEDETVKERTGHAPSYAKAKKNEVANTSYPRASLLRDWSSSSMTQSLISEVHSRLPGQFDTSKSTFAACLFRSNTVSLALVSTSPIAEIHYQLVSLKEYHTLLSSFFCWPNYLAS